MSEMSRAEADDASAGGRYRREPEAFAEVVRRDAAPDTKRCVTRRRGVEAAEEVVAETFLKAPVASPIDWQGLPTRSERALLDLPEGASLRRSPNDITRR